MMAVPKWSLVQGELIYEHAFSVWCYRVYTCFSELPVLSCSNKFKWACLSYGFIRADLVGEVFKCITSRLVKLLLFFPSFFNHGYRFFLAQLFLNYARKQRRF